jgi:hypothetical protein
MKLSAFLGLAGVLAIVFGLEFLLIPDVALWLARGAQEAAVQRALLFASIIGNLIGVVLSLWSRFSGLQGILAWLSVGIYGALLLGSLYFLLRPGRRG